MLGVVNRAREGTQAPDGTRPTDEQLLEAFIKLRDERAFATLLRFHGPMVLGVCQRILRNVHDAEEAFQATFLVLARKAGSIRSRESVANWLFGVARRAALKAKGTRARRQVVERQFSDMPETTAVPHDLWPEVEPVLDQELSRLPEKYRTPVILCDLEGKTQLEAATQLGVTPGAISMRLTRAHKMLAKTLTRRGLTVSTGVVAALLAQNSASVAVPASLFAATLKSASLLAAGKTATAAVVSVKVAAITDGVAKSMSLAAVTKLSVVSTVVVAVGLGAAGVAVRNQPETQIAAAPPRAVAPPSSPAVPPARQPAKADDRAQELALKAHAQAAAIDKLPRLYIRGLDGAHDSENLPDPSPDPLKNLLRTLETPIGRKLEYVVEHTLAWDERHFLSGDRWFNNPTRDPEPPINGLRGDLIKSHFNWGTRELAGVRGKDGERPPFLVMRPDAAAIWKTLSFSNPNYFLATCHEFWWGDNMYPSQSYRSQCFSPIPPTAVTYQRGADETFDGELCHVVESFARRERLWISQKTGRCHGYVQTRPTEQGNEPAVLAGLGKVAGRKFSTSMEYNNWYYAEADKLPLEKRIQLQTVWGELTSLGKTVPGLLVRFRDFREVAPGVWWPFREDRAQSFASDAGFKCFHSTYRVEEIRTDLDLTERVDALRPQPGERVRDLRFNAPTEYIYSATRTQAELRQPFADLVGKRAPLLPKTGWVGGGPPNVSGKPYLVHFWHLSCQPSTYDTALLKKLSDEGAIIVALHPAGTPATDIKQIRTDFKITYPMYLEPDNSADSKAGKSAGYPAQLFPYCVLVDARGNVAAHGWLEANDKEIVRQFEALRKQGARK